MSAHTSRLSGRRRATFLKVGPLARYSTPESRFVIRKSAPIGVESPVRRVGNASGTSELLKKSFVCLSMSHPDECGRTGASSPSFAFSNDIFALISEGRPVGCWNRTVDPEG